MNRRKDALLNKLASLKDEAQLAKDLLDLSIENSEKQVKMFLSKSECATNRKQYPLVCELLDRQCNHILDFNCAFEPLVKNSRFAVEELKSYKDLRSLPRPTSILTKHSNNETCIEELGAGPHYLQGLQELSSCPSVQTPPIEPVKHKHNNPQPEPDESQEKEVLALPLNQSSETGSLDVTNRANNTIAKTEDLASSHNQPKPGFVTDINLANTNTRAKKKEILSLPLSQHCKAGPQTVANIATNSLSTVDKKEEVLDLPTHQPLNSTVNNLTNNKIKCLSTVVMADTITCATNGKDGHLLSSFNRNESFPSPSISVSDAGYISVTPREVETSVPDQAEQYAGDVKHLIHQSDTSGVSVKQLQQPDASGVWAKQLQSSDASEVKPKVLQQLHTSELGPKSLPQSGTSGMVENLSGQSSAATSLLPCVDISKTTVECTATSDQSSTTVLLPSPPTPCLQRGDVAHMVYVSGDSPWSFCLRFPSKSSVVSDMISRYQAADQLVPFTAPRAGDYVFASSGARFLRGRVEVVHRNARSIRDVTILDLDTGLKQVVKSASVWHPVAEINKWRFEAIPCTMHGLLKDRTSIWRPTCVQMFKEAMENSDLTITVMDKRVDEDGIQELYTVDVFARPEDGIGDRNKLDMVLNIVVANIHKTKRQHPSGSCASSTSSDHTSMVTATDRSLELKIPSSAKKPGGSEIYSVHALTSTDDDFISFSSSGRSSTNQGSKTLPVAVQQPVCSLKLKENYSDMFTCEKPCVGILASVSAPCEFYFHISCKENATIDDFHEKLNDFYKMSMPNLPTKSVARHRMTRLCACYYQGPEYKGWFRAQVLEWRMGKRDMLMQLVDYGDKFVTLLKNIRLLHPCFTEQPAFAVRCHLAYVKPPLPYLQWPVEGVRLFKLYADVSKNYQIIPSETVPEAPPFRQGMPVSTDMNHSLSVAVLLVDLTNNPPVTINDVLEEQCFASFVDFSEKMDTGNEVILEEMDSMTKVEDWFRKTSPSNIEATPHASNPTPVGKQQETSTRNPLPVSRKLDLSASVSARFCAEVNPTEQDVESWNPMLTDYENQDYDDENACVAVSGYDAKDESRICEFFAKEGKCYKGLKCRKEHTFFNPYGFTTDQEIISVRTFASLHVPRCGEIPLEVTFVPHDKPYFYAIIPSTSETEETLATLSENMNKPSNVRKFKRVQITPAKGQIVLALYSMDNHWYRAKVVDTSNDEDIVYIVYVDYGNEDTVFQSNIRLIEDRFLHLPFQAIQCYLANVEWTTSKLEAAAGVFSSLVQDKVLCAKIVEWQEALGILYCELADDEGDDVGCLLAQRGFGSLVDNASYMHFVDDPSIPIPG